MASMFNINQVNPLSPQILAAWNADAAAYNATNPKYPYPAAPSGHLWRLADLPGRTAFRAARNTRIGPTARRVSALRIVLNDKTVIRGGFGIVLSVHHQQCQLANRLQPDHQLPVQLRYRKQHSFGLRQSAGTQHLRALGHPPDRTRWSIRSRKGLRSRKAHPKGRWPMLAKVPPASTCTTRFPVPTSIRWKSSGSCRRTFCSTFHSRAITTCIRIPAVTSAT